MKFDAQTLMLLALVAFVFMGQQKKKPLISDDTVAQLAALLKQVVSLKGNVAELQKRIDELHSVSTAGY